MEIANMSENTSNLQREGLSVAEACAVAGIGRTKIYEAISSGALKARKFGKRRIILRSDLHTFLAALPTTI
jgi:excisionase family DNA binding protein